MHAHLLARAMMDLQRDFKICFAINLPQLFSARTYSSRIFLTFDVVLEDRSSATFVARCFTSRFLPSILSFASCLSSSETVLSLDSVVIR